MRRVFKRLEWCLNSAPDRWEDMPPLPDKQYAMLWPGQYYELVQRQRGVLVPSSMRQVDGSAELQITAAYEQMNVGLRLRERE